MRTQLAPIAALLASLAVAACHAPPASSVGSAVTPPGAGAEPATPTRLPLLYADLFVDGASWSFPATAEKRDRDQFGVEFASDVVHATVTCRMSGVMVIRGGKRGQLDCTADRADFELTNAPGGILVGTADGLWEAPFDFNNDVASLEARRVVLAPHPAEGRRDLVDPGAGLAGEDFVQAIETYQVAGGWCFVYHMDGEWEGHQLCVRAGTGIIGGGGFYLGAGATLFEFGANHPL